MKKITLSISLFVFLSLMVFSSSIFAIDISEHLDPNVPESWNQPPKTAFDLNITEFNESPLLREKVKEGEIPPVAERLPKDPIVIEPYEEIGKYGGTFNVWGVNLSDFTLGWNVVAPQGDTPLHPKYNGEGVIPWLAKSWEYSDDYKKITLNFREGLKWSDGEPFTADDYIFWWEHFISNNDLDARNPENLVPSILNVTKEDKNTVTFHHGMSYPNNHKTNFQRAFIQNKVFSMAPSHYMKKFHPDFIGQEKVEEMAQEAGLDNWVDFYMRIMEESRYHPEYEHKAPTMDPWVAVDRTETYILFERNPYYPFIDPEGNQLPYVDKIRVNLANSSDMAESKAITGEADLAYRDLKGDHVPSYLQNEDKGNYRTNLYSFTDSARPAIYVNMTHEDPEKRGIFQDVRFRRALSVSMNRERINENIYYGNAVPMQISIFPTSPHYKEKYSQAYIEFNPENAKKLLDEMGMTDINGDGYRETPDGNKFNPTFSYVDYTMMGPISQMELIVEDWRDIGLNVDLETVGRSMYWQKMSAGEFDIHPHPASNLVPITALGAIAKFLSPHATQAPCNPWPQWTHWVASDGDTGMEPPENIKELINYTNQFLTSPDEEKRAEAIRILSENLAENLWGIGTVGFTPQPMIVKNSIKNVPKKGLWGPGTTRLNLYRPVQFYFDE